MIDLSYNTISKVYLNHLSILSILERFHRGEAWGVITHIKWIELPAYDYRPYIGFSKLLTRVIGKGIIFISSNTTSHR